MSFLSDTPKLLAAQATIASTSSTSGGGPSSPTTTAAGGAAAGAAAQLHLSFTPAHEGRDDVVPAVRNMSIRLTRGQVSLLVSQLSRMLKRFDGGDASAMAGGE